MRSALDVHRELLARGVPHEIVRLRSRILSADDLPRVLGLDAGCVAVRLYLVTGQDGAVTPAAVLVPAGAVPDRSALLEALSARTARPATAAEVNAITSFAAGLVSPVGLPPEVPVLADAAVGGSDVVYTAVGEGALALGIRTHDLLVVTAARVTSLTPAPLPADDGRFADVVTLDAWPTRCAAG